MTEEVLRAVGWLDPTREFERGTVEPAVAARLAEFAADHAVNRTRGLDRCGLCDSPDEVGVARRRPAVSVEVGGRKVTLGGAEIWIESPEGERYAAPDLILHYIVDHGYRPPEEFHSAVLAGRPLSP